MAKPRITCVVSKNERGEPSEVFLYLNPEGRDRFVQELLALDERSEHFHLMGPAWGVNDLQGVAYEPSESAMPHLKVMLRLDAWDEQHFPHVMDRPS